VGDVNASQEVFEALQTIYKNAPGATRNAMLKEYRSLIKETNGPGIKQTIGLAMLRKIAGEKKK